MINKVLKIGHSPDPDDAFMFYGLAKNLVKIEDFTIQHIMEDIQTLNIRALDKELEVTAISAHLFPYISDHYYIMKTGSSMGYGYGPVLISKKYKSIDEIKNKLVAHPGDFTTATLLTKLYVPDVKLLTIPFDKIMMAIDNEIVDAGVIIHEGQITYKDLGYNLLMDYGKEWEKESNLPLPLGLDVVKKDLGHNLAKKISDGLKKSIEFGYNNLSDAVKYAQEFGRGLNPELTEKFVKMYVNELTIDMGKPGKEALKLLFDKAYEKDIIRKKIDFELV